MLRLLLCWLFLLRLPFGPTTQVLPQLLLLTQLLPQLLLFLLFPIDRAWVGDQYIAEVVSQPLRLVFHHDDSVRGVLLLLLVIPQGRG